MKLPYKKQSEALARAHQNDDLMHYLTDVSQEEVTALVYATDSDQMRVAQGRVQAIWELVSVIEKSYNEELNRGDAAALNKLRGQRF